MAQHMLALRDYQEDTLAKLFARWGETPAAPPRVPSVLATGLGKTVIFSHAAERFLADNPRRRVLILAHTDELVLQAADKMRKVAPHRSVGIVKATQNEVHAQVIVASVQTLRSAKRRTQLRNVGMLIIDECFPAGTMVGDKPIEQLKAGDLVPSWNEKTGKEEMRRVVAPMRSTPKGMVRVTLADGSDFACTPNHPILTTQGWCPARGLWRGAQVVSFTHDANAESHLHGVRQGSDLDHEGEDRHLPSKRPNVLPGCMSGCMGQERSVCAHGSHESEACVATDDRSQSHGSPGSARQGVGNAESDWPQATRAGWQRKADARTATSSCGTSGVAYGSDRSSIRWGDALALQAGHRTPIDDGVRGSRRGVPLLDGPPRIRPTEGRKAVLSRVASVQVLESGSDGTYGGVCPDGYVYNVEVEGTHTYLINDGIVAHNCHHATATTYRTIIEHFEDVDPTLRIAGFTATLARGDKAKLSDVWAAPAVTYGISYGIRHGYLLDVRGKRVVVPDLNLANVRKSGGDFQEASLAEELDRTFAPEIVAEAYRKHAADRKGLCFTPTVDSAYQFADAFTQAHIPAAVVHGGLGKLERRLILKRLAGGDVQVVVNCAVLTEGFDDPTISCVVIARPTRSGPLYQQMVGRGLRPDLSLPPETRGDCLVLDVVGASKSHDLRTLVDLSERRIPPEISEDSDLSLTEIEDLSIQIEETNPGPGFELDELYTGQTETIDFDPLGRRTSVGGWLKTDDGTFFLPAGTGAYVLLAPGDMPNTHDVAWITKQAGLSIHGQEAALTEHRGLSLDMACSWAEETMQSLGANLEDELSAARRRRKSKLEPSNRQLAMASTLRMDISRMTRGEATDAILTRLASARIDPVVRAFVSAREKESE